MAGYGKPDVDNKVARIRSTNDLKAHFGLSDNQADLTGGNGLLDFLDELRLANGINPVRLVNDMETAAEWTETDNGEFDIAVNTTDEIVGTNCQKFTATGAGDGTQFISTNYIDAGTIPAKVYTNDETPQMNWEESDYVGFWAKADTAGDFSTAGDLKFNIKNNGTWGTAVNVPALVSSIQMQRLEVDITSFQRDRVEQIRFELQDSVAAGEDMSIDQMVRYKFGNGYGPVFGRCQPFMITSGSTVTQKQVVSFGSKVANTIETVAAASAASAANVGPVVVGGTGGNDLDVCWVQVDGYSYWPVGTTVLEQETLIWGTGHKLIPDLGSTLQDYRVIARLLAGTTVLENRVILVQWGYFIQDGANVST